MSKRNLAYVLLALTLVSPCFASAQQAKPNVSSSHKFMVGWELHYGYYLEDRAQNVWAFPDFEDEAVRATFDAFFSNENLAKQVGKRIYCECQGYWVQERFHVTSARLSAE